MQRMIKTHDGIVGAIILFSVIMAFKVNPDWLYLAGAISALMVLSAFTGFCPVYFLLKKMNAGEKSPGPAS
jgi:phosphate/sulfate permease